MGTTEQDVIREIIKQSNHRNVRWFIDTQQEANRTWSEVLENIVYHLLRENAVLRTPSKADIAEGMREFQEYANKLSNSQEQHTVKSGKSQ
jgi:hypothetical protein